MVLAMLTFYFDAGGDETTSLLTVAGFASSTKDWDAFSIAWKKRLDQSEIQFFRAVDFASFRGPFQHWHDRWDRETLRRRLSSELMDILKSHVYRRFACTIINKDFQKMNESVRKEFALSAYSLAGRTCEKYARKWASEQWRANAEMPLALIFEAGDRGHGKLQERLRRDLGHIPANFRPKKDTVRADGAVEHGLMPLQAADWLAWEVNRATRDYYEQKLESESSLRWPMQEFLRYPPGHMGIYTPNDLKEMETGFELQKKITDWGIATGLPETRTPQQTPRV
jgi:hypothetical protein